MNAPAVETPISRADLQQYLLDHIAIYRALGAEVHTIGHDSVILTAPLEENLNHHGTVFGGSASAVAILAGWSLIYVTLQKGSRERLFDPRFECGDTSLNSRSVQLDIPKIVIQRSNMEYRSPIASQFEARAHITPGTSWDFFLRSLRRKRIGRVSIDADIICRNQHAASFRGTYVASVGSNAIRNED
jgi:acyl-coenzyme A thioesterase PaaI-like protein